MPDASDGKKYFVLDTNVLLHNAQAINSFADNAVVLPIYVLEELDRFKARNDELGRNARLVIRTLDRYRSKGPLSDGAPNDSGGVVLVPLSPPKDLRLSGLENRADNRIIGTAYRLHEEGREVIFVTKDINARIKAAALGLTSVDFEKQKVSIEELYSGWKEIQTDGKAVDRFYSQRHLDFDVENLFPNQFVLLKDGANEKHTALARVRKEQGRLTALSTSSEHVWNISPRNMQQRMALELLLDDKVSLVTLVGMAGTGKTLIALAAGLQRVVHEKAFDQMLVGRPIMPLGRDIGYLPGTKEEKLTSWMEPIFDNLRFLLAGRGKSTDHSIDSLIEDGTMELEALTYIRGRSLPNLFVVIDEGQNLTPHEVKTVISRAGLGTKMVITGDPYQIDNPYLDSSSNGLTYAADRLKDSPLHGHMTLVTSERSPLASLAAERL